MRTLLKWVSTRNKLPEYGEPVLIVIGSTVQHIIYMRDGADDAPDWFEPHALEHDDELKIPWQKVDFWTYLPERPG